MKSPFVAKSEPTSKRLVIMRSGDERSSLGEVDFAAQEASVCLEGGICSSFIDGAVKDEAVEIGAAEDEIA